MPSIQALDQVGQSMLPQFNQGQGQAGLQDYMPQQSQGGIPTPPMGDPMAQGQSEIPDLGQVTISDLLTMGLNALLNGLASMQPPQAAPAAAPPAPGIGAEGGVGPVGPGLA